MFGGRQTVAVWGSFALGCLLAAQMQRPEKAQRHASAWVEDSQGMAIALESSPFAGPTPFEQRVIAVATREGLDPAPVPAVVGTATQGAGLSVKGLPCPTTSR